MIRAIVFDLDGTLANTADLGAGTRLPGILLGSGVDGYGAPIARQDWGWSREVSDVPARLIERGYRVAVATRAPLAYASTLLHLLGADYHVLRHSCGGGTAKHRTVTNLGTLFGVGSSEIAYCGDLDEDSEIARLAGASFIHARHLKDLSILERLQPVDAVQAASTASSPTHRFTSAAQCYATLVAETDGLQPRSITSNHDHLLRAYLQMVEVKPVPDLGESGEPPTTTALTHPTPAYRAAMATRILSVYPNNPFRREFQVELFQHLGPLDAGSVLSGTSTNRFGVGPQLITRRELMSDTGLKNLYLAALSRIWPPIGNTTTSLSSVMCYDLDGNLGKILRTAKNYGGELGTRYRSGPNVQLDYVTFVADLVASRMHADPPRPIVPVPSSAFSDEHPGQFSIRMAARVAELSNRLIVPLVIRRGDELAMNDQLLAGASLPSVVDLVDDQVTNGGSLASCRRVLAEAGVAVRKSYTYSANNRVLTGFSRPSAATLDDRLAELAGIVASS